MTEETTPPPEGQPSSPFNADGTLVENWHTLAPEGYEELRDSKTLPRIKKFWDLGKSYENVRRQVPLEKIPRPNENFTDNDWNEWHKAGGRPDTPEDYKITRPKDFPEEYWDDNRSKEFQKVFHQLGLSKKQSEKLVEFNNQLVLKAVRAQEQQEELEQQTIEDTLHEEWGAAYPNYVHRGNIAIENDKDAKKDLAYKERLLEKINKDPDLIRFASNMGISFMEDSPVETPQIPTPGDMNERISKAMQEISYLNDRHPDHKRQVQLVQQLFAEREKLKSKTG